MKANRIIFLGQKPVGELCFERLLDFRAKPFERPLEVRGAVTHFSEDVWWRSRSIYEQSLKRKIPCIDVAKRHEEEILSLIREESIETLISVQHPWILSEAILAAVNSRAFNLHCAKLPEYQGHNACNHALLNGESEFTTTLHWMVKKVDAGAIAFVDTFKVDPDDHAQSLYRKGIQSALRNFDSLLRSLATGADVPKWPIPSGRETFYPRSSLDELRSMTGPSDPENAQFCDELERKTKACYFPPFEMASIRCGEYRFFCSPEPVVHELEWKSLRIDPL